jgi:hypothetical protein
METTSILNEIINQIMYRFYGLIFDKFNIYLMTELPMIYLFYLETGDYDVRYCRYKLMNMS